MAEYYPLISRAVAGLRTSTPEARQTIYERARSALIGQLRAMDPPVPEDAIARETTALDEAIARTEAECRSSQSTSDAVKEAPEPPRSELPPRAPLRSRPAMPPLAGGSRSAPTLGGVQRSGTGAASEAPAIVRPPVSVRRELPSSDAARARPLRPLPLEPEPTPPISDAARPEPEPTLPAATKLTVEPIAEDRRERAFDNETASGDIAASSEDRAREEGIRPAAPRPAPERSSNLRVWIVAAVALVAVVAIGFTAWRLRDRPEELARAPAVVQPAETSAGKIVERADGSSGTSTQSDAGSVVVSDQATQNATEPAAAAPTTGSSASQPNATPTPATPSTSGQSAALSAASANGAAASPGAGDLAIPVAYKAAILVDAPDTPEKVKTYVGTVLWRSTSVPQGQGQPLATEIEASIDIPEAKVQLAMQIRRNTEAQLPASHTIDLKFTVQPDSPLGTIKQINVPQMRQPDMPTGDPLGGIPVTIADNYFLIGLMRGSAEERNLDLLRSRQWFDIPMLLANGKASKITFEKGGSGDKIFADVLDAWKSAAN